MLKVLIFLELKCLKGFSKKIKNVRSTGFEPVTPGFPHFYSPMLCQLSYDRSTELPFLRLYVITRDFDYCNFFTFYVDERENKSKTILIRNEM